LLSQPTLHQIDLDPAPTELDSTRLDSTRHDTPSPQHQQQPSSIRITNYDRISTRGLLLVQLASEVIGCLLLFSLSLSLSLSQTNLADVLPHGNG
jgi:hypothetical protein